MKIALVHDWLIRFGGAEKVLQVLHRLFPQAPIYTILYNKEKMEAFFPDADIRPSFLQKFPNFIKRNHKYLLPFLPVVPETFNLSEFDIVLSSSSAFAKGIIVKPKTVHISYTHAPMRYAWDSSYEYYAGQKRNFISKMISKSILHYIRLWDRRASKRVDYFIANSKATQKRIWKYYNRKSKVIYPGVKMDSNFDNMTEPASNGLKTKNELPLLGNNFFLIVSQLTPYKKIDVAVEAFNKLELPLVVVGTGSHMKYLKKIARSNIFFLGWQDDEVVKECYRRCEAFIFAGEDDFGITAVEAMSYGKPVLAFNKGGVTESVIEGVTGEFFSDPLPEILADGIRRIRQNMPNYSPLVIKKRAEKFSEDMFISEIMNFVSTVANNRQKGLEIRK